MPPSDAIVLFDGKNLSKWAQRSREGKVSNAQWAVHDGVLESGPAGSISTRESFGDVQLHIEFATPSGVARSSQGHVNSGVILMGRYENPILDSFSNRTYADGMAASIYGEWPLLVNAARGGAALTLQNHGNSVLFRNIRIRRLTGYDQQER